MMNLRLKIRILDAQKGHWDEDFFTSFTTVIIRVNLQIVEALSYLLFMWLLVMSDVILMRIKCLVLHTPLGCRP